jgi:hypothetical protein
MLSMLSATTHHRSFIMIARTRTGHSITRRWILGTALALSVTGAGFAQAEELKWYNTSYVTKNDPATGAFTRRGLGNFSTGEIGVMVLDGTMTPEFKFTGKMVYTFEDGSTILLDMIGQGVERTPDGRSRQAGDVLITGGTGRFEGITGKGTFKARSLNPFGPETKSDTYGNFAADYSLPKK